MSRPTMDRAIEALDRHDVEQARALCEEMKHEWRYLHDPMVETIAARDRRQIVHAIAASWRAHSCTGTGPHPGPFSITEDGEKFTFAMNPCGSGQRLVRMGRYEGPDALGVTPAAHDWSYGREGFPLYCTHCPFTNESLPIKWIGYPLYPSDPADDFGRDPCTWYWYKGPADIPNRHWERYGSEAHDARG